MCKVRAEVRVSPQEQCRVLARQEGSGGRCGESVRVKAASEAECADNRGMDCMVPFYASHYITTLPIHVYIPKRAWTECTPVYGVYQRSNGRIGNGRSAHDVINKLPPSRIRV